MTSNSLRSMYKSKIREENTVSSRRMSRGLERKKNREDEVNKRRLLNLMMDMSPIVEDKNSKDEKPGKTHQKAPTHLERLKQWREEKKQKAEKEKKEKKKPLFKVSPLKHKREADLYKMTKPSEMIPIKANVGSFPAKLAVVVNNNKKASRLSAKEVVKSENMSTKAPRAGTSGARQTTKAKPATKEISTRSTRRAVATNGTNQPAVQVTAQRRGKTDLSVKLTASAAAKTKSLDKPREFLRSKARNTAAKNKKKELHLRHSTPVPRKSISSDSLSGDEKVPDCSLLNKVAEMEVTLFSEEKITSILTPPVKNNRSRKSSRRSVFNVDVIKEKNHNTTIEDSAADLVNELEISNKENILHDEVDIREKILRKSVSKWNMNMTPRAQLRRKSKRLGAVNDQELCGEEPADLYTSIVDKNNDESRSRKRNQQLISSNDESDSCVENITASSTAKRPKRSVTKKTASLLEAEELSLALEPTVTCDTQLPVIIPVTPRPQQETKFCSAVAKRRSVRIAGLVTSSASDTNSENEVGEATKYPKTPRFKRRPSTQTSLTNQEDCRRSSYVSVSDEGTSDVIGERAVDKMELPVTPRHTQYTMSSKSARKLRKSTRKSHVIDVSDEGTALSTDHDPFTVYQVGKPGEHESSSRALQELAVEKFDGEVSFIEVPVDETADANVLVENISPSKHVVITASDAQDVVEDNTSHTTVASEEGNQSTQPFTPRGSSDVSKVTVSSSQSPATPFTQHITAPNMPRSSKNSELFINSVPFFKTPSQPSTTRSLRKRRQTEQSTPLKSPEEMIEILKNSPMVEMTRRRSRFVSSSATISPTNLDTMLAATESGPELDTPVAGSMDTEATQIQDVRSSNTEPATIDLSNSQPIEPVQLNLHDGVKHFRDLLVSETSRLNQLCNEWNEVISSSTNLGEDALGQIRLTVGKAQLLMDQRFKQFSGLVDNCEFNLGEKATTLTDLQGFWEMIYLQVEDVSKLFSQLSEFQLKNWNMEQLLPARDVPKIVQRKLVKLPKPKIRSNFASFREEMMRRRVQVSTVKSSSEEESETNKVFDAGFFRVTSPIRSPSGKKSQQNSPLMPTVVSDAAQPSSSCQEKLTQVVENLDNSNDQPSTPVSQHNKENNTAIMLSSRLSSMSAKRLSYLPVVPSPLLNDITGLLPKKL